MSDTNEPTEQHDADQTDADQKPGLGQRAAVFGAKLAAAAQPMMERATEVAQSAAVASAPRAAQMKDRAAELAERAGEIGARGTGVVAGSVDRATGGKYSSKISGIASKLQKRLDPDEQTPTAPSTGPAPTEAAAPATPATAPDRPAADEPEVPLS
jgi:hypothetical protein